MARARDTSRMKCVPLPSPLHDIVRANSERSFMHLVITLAVAIGAALLIGCAEPVAPDSADAPSARLRRAPKDGWSVPDSVGIPPSPVPPIYEEVPLEAP
jgi:hypothetical protein